MIGLVLAVVLFAINYGRIELVHEVAFGATYHSNVDRPPAERAALRGSPRVQILRVNGYVFFGAASGLLERIRKRVEPGTLRFLVIDLRRVTGIDSSAVMSFRKVAQLAEANGFELVFTGVPEPVERQLARGGVASRSTGSCGSNRTWTAACSGARTGCWRRGRARRGLEDGPPVLPPRPEAYLGAWSARGRGRAAPSGRPAR